MMKVDCIIVLANEMDKEGNLNLESEARVKLACDAYFKAPSTPLITCGWDYRKDSKIFIADVFKKYAVDLGVPEENITAELNSRDTVGDAFFTKLNIVKHKPWKNLLVVTSDYHVDRTSIIFNFIYGDQYNIKVIGSPAPNSNEKQANEQKSIDAFKHTFENIQAGDDAKIYEGLSTKHPFYNGDIYAKINMELQINETKNKVLFLGPSDSPIFTWLVERGENVFSRTEKISVDYVIENQFTFLVSYGFRHILRKDVLDLFPNSAINMHISYLPYNRGADPNFWSFIENTPKGVTIHYLDEGVDTGDIIAQKELFFDLDVETLGSSYEKLQLEIQNLFFQNWDTIKNQKCDRIVQVGKSTTHRLKDKKPLLHLMEKNGWNTKVSTLINFSEELNKQSL